MSDKTGIQWTDATWNPVRGCSRVSEGCRNCYAEAVAARFSGPGQPYDGLADRTRSGSKWTGKVRLVEHVLVQPLRWSRPRRIFVNSMSDLFHESLSDEEIGAIFAIMAAAPRHTFQVLTKRPERMRKFIERISMQGPINDLGWLQVALGRYQGEWVEPAMEDVMRTDWPLPNVWLGVSVEDQKTADERIPHLLKTPAAVRFLSCEPLLEKVDLSRWFDVWGVSELSGKTECTGIDWVIVGGESGPRARRFCIDWADSLIKQCGSAGVACFVKQLGSAHTPNDIGVNDHKGGKIEEWPEFLRVRQFPEVGP